jgi:hypothetical protein
MNTKLTLSKPECFIYHSLSFYQFPFGHDTVCLLSVSLCPWYCLSFVTSPLAMLLSVFCQFPWKRETDKRQTIAWPKVKWQKTDNIMAKGKLTKDRHYHGQRETEKNHTISWTKGNWQTTDNMSFFSFLLAMILSVFCQPPFVHDIVSLCQFPFGHDVVCLLSVSLCPW